jgi:formylmethanofuran dehydrogenase subunit B
MTAAGSLRIVEDATCPACGCACDDIELVAQDHRIADARNACERGRRWFAEQQADAARPAALIGGSIARIDDAIDEAARVLAGARYPLVYGLSHTTCESQRAAVELAELLGACLDTATSVTHAPSLLALQWVGEVTCTLGEIRNRADLVIVWGIDPEVSHPRHFARYSVEPAGRFTPRGREGRYVVVVDVEPTASARAADLFVPVQPGKQFELLWTLRAVLKGIDVEPGVHAETGVPIEAVRALVDRMKRARYGVFLFGPSSTAAGGRHYEIGALLSLTRDLNSHTRFAAMPMRASASGADNVLSWSTGYPFAVNFGRGYPRFNPGEFTAVDLANRAELDALLFISSDPAGDLPRAVIERLRRVPTVVIGSTTSAVAQGARAAVATAVPGIDVGGTVYRMDDVSIPLRAALPSTCPSDEDVLRELTRRVRAIRAASATG